VSSSFRITRDTLTPNLATMNPRIERAVGLVFDLFEPRAETRLREMAHWTDRTGNARAGLRALHEGTGDDHTLILFHTMPYGVYLELAHDGKYAVLGPVQRIIAEEMMRVMAVAVRRAMEGAA
jgi:hypothetical protein